MAGKGGEAFYVDIGGDSDSKPKLAKAPPR